MVVLWATTNPTEGSAKATVTRVCSDTRAAGTGGTRAASSGGTGAIGAGGARAGGLEGIGVGGTGGAGAGGVEVLEVLVLEAVELEALVLWPPLLHGSPLPAPSPYPAQTGSLAESREP
ncbi:unnamed protein product [Closterium sp. NIES-54]